MSSKLIFAFIYDQDVGYDVVYITPKEDFEKDNVLSGDSGIDVGEEFYELMENIFEYECTTKEARKKLISLGLEESKDLYNFLMGE